MYILSVIDFLLHNMKEKHKTIHESAVAIQSHNWYLQLLSRQ